MIEILEFMTENWKNFFMATFLISLISVFAISFATEIKPITINHLHGNIVNNDNDDKNNQDGNE